MRLLSRHPTLAAIAIAGWLAVTGAQAQVVYTQANIDFTDGSTSFGYMGTQFTFSDVSTADFDFAPVGVTTAGGAAVTSLGAPFYDPPQPSTFFDPLLGGGPVFFDGSYQYSSFSGAAIPFSLAPGIVGLALTLADGVHYGFAEFASTLLVSYAFETMAGVGINVAVPVSPVPEPETYALLLAGLGAVGFAARRRKAKAEASAGGAVAVAC